VQKHRVNDRWRASGALSDRGANGVALMTSEVVHDDNVAGREDREENLLDISSEACAIDRSVDDAGRGQPSQRNAARNVSVCHLPKGALATRRAPLAVRVGKKHLVK
jgi:hypothetical protein